MPDILFVILDACLTLETSAVFQAQVVDQAVALRKLGHNVLILCAYKDMDQFQLVVGDKLRQEDVHVHMILDKGLFRNLFSFVGVLRSEILNCYSCTGYVRGVWGAMAIILSNPLRTMPYVYDVRGDIVDESFARGIARIRFLLIIILEKLSLRRARYVTSVTNHLASIVRNRAMLKVSPIVIPSCVDINLFSFDEMKRLSRRRQLGYSDNDIVFVYSGGLSHYQMIPEMLLLWQGMFAATLNVKFLLLINSDIQYNSSYLECFSDFADRLQIMNLQRSEVFGSLIAADIGFLLRENRELNSSASPVKFAEYLAAGLSVVSSPCVGDISDLIVNRQIGVLVDPKNTECGIDRVEKYLQKYKLNQLRYRLNSLNLAKESYSWHSHQKLYDVLYGQSIK